MSTEPERQRSLNEEQTRAFGRGLAARLGPGDVLLLSGILGAGKTCLSKGLAEGLGLDARTVLSPTFQLAREHHGGRLPLFHLDLYRLAGPAEAAALGLEDYFDGEGICVVEWPERLGPLAPRGAWRLEIGVEADGARLLSLWRP